MGNRPPRRGIWAAVAFAAAAFVLLSPLHAQNPDNLLIIVADDLGVDYVGCYKEGTTPPPTPHIDGLAQRGVLFRNAWANPSCSPTRASLLTGRYPFRTTVGRWIRHLNNSEPIGTVAASEWTLPELLDRAGGAYAHACVGKWHVHDVTHGSDAPRVLGGFDHFAGSLEGQIPSYTSWTRVVDGAAAHTTRYCTTQNTDDALAWIKQQNGPWMLFLTYQAPHIPYHAPPASLHTQNLSGLTPQSGHTPQNRPFYRAMVESLDTEMGRLFTQLGAGTMQKTNVIFVGDNGSVQRQAVAPFDPNRAKGTPYEGGINVPMIVAGPAVRSPGREVGALTVALDIFATALDLCGARPALPAHVQHDSVSLLPYLQNPTQAALRQFAFAEEFRGDTWPSPNQNGHAMVRNDRYKLIRRMTRGDELYDLQADPFERSNLLNGTLSSTQQQNHTALLNEIARLRSPRGKFVRYGQGGCQGSAGQPQISAVGTPSLGQSFSIQLSSAAAGRPAALVTGVSDATWAGATLPLDLGILGAGPQCRLDCSLDVLLFVATDNQGQAAIPLTVPQLNSLVGHSLFHTWLIDDPQAPGNPAGLVSSAGAASVLGL